METKKQSAKETKDSEDIIRVLLIIIILLFGWSVFLTYQNYNLRKGNTNFLDMSLDCYIALNHSLTQERDCLNFAVDCVQTLEAITHLETYPFSNITKEEIEILWGKE